MKPMLAGTVKEGVTIPFPVYASPKLDGIRAVISGGRLLSRKLLDIPNHATRESLSLDFMEGADGELIVGAANHPSVYNTTASGIMTREGEPPVTFWLFDRWNSRLPYAHRVEHLSKFVARYNNVRIRLLERKLICNQGELLEYEQETLALGYEGVMLRATHGVYKYGRSTPREFLLMKLKRFEDSEAVVLGIVEQLRNENEATINHLGRTKRSSHKDNKIPKGTTGALQCRDLKTGIEFEIGTGMDDATREEFWTNPPVGQIVKYKFQPHGVKEKPRFPVYLTIRYD